MGGCGGVGEADRVGWEVGVGESGVVVGVRPGGGPCAAGVVKTVVRVKRSACRSGGAGRGVCSAGSSGDRCVR